jgi:hypothetical protein
LTALFGGGAYGANMSELVGNWYSEATDGGNRTVDGKRYTMRRELLVNRGDGSKSNIERYYNGPTVVFEIVTMFKWGVNGGLYWTECQTNLFKGSAKPCSDRFEYDLSR